ncbi:MAG: cellulase family glycosylhydrolase [Verrucomicrobiota bacterium]
MKTTTVPSALRRAFPFLLAAACATAGLDLQAQTAVPKRGLCANKLSPEDIKALEPGVGWWYSWYHETNDGVRGSPMQFIPMIWDEAPDRLTGAENFLRRSPKPPLLFAINEPNLTGQANLAPQDAVESWNKISRLAKSRGIPLIGPHMAIGAPGNEIVNGWDPIQNKRRNLSYMIDWMDAFFHYVDPATVDGLGLHAYGNIHELKWSVGELHKKYNKPVWMTEFAWWDAKDTAEEAAYMIEALDFLERDPRVAGYAWFKERMGRGPTKLNLLEEGKPGELTKLGKIYVHFPTHDPKFFAKVPGRIEAEADTTMSGVKPALTTDPGGKFEVGDIDAGDWMDYQIEVAAAGRYRLDLRTRGGRPVAMKVHCAGRQIGALKGEASPETWQTIGTEVTLPAGRHTLRLEAEGGGYALNWLELKRL